MVLNPVYLLASLYFFSNAYAFIMSFLGYGLVVEQYEYYFDSSIVVKAFFLQVFCLIFLIYIYKFFSKGRYKERVYLKSKWGFLSILLVLVEFLYAYSSGNHLAGEGVNLEGRGIAYYFFVIFQPVAFFCIVSVYLKSNSIFLLNSLVFLIVMFFKGWMGAVFIFVIICLCRYYPVKFNFKKLLLFFISSILLLFMLPFLLEAKWVVRRGLDLYLVFYNVFDYGYFDYLVHSVDYIMNRFQHVGHVSLIIEEIHVFEKAYVEGGFIKYYQEGVFQHLILSFINIKYWTLNAFMVEELFGIINPTWNTNPGLAGWLIILGIQSIFFLLYIFIFLFVIYYLSLKVSDFKSILLLSSFSIVYLFHGWVGAYLDFLIFVLFYMILIKIKPSSFFIKTE